jgi:uncharacterized protein YhbP (UPF0306 family)
LSEGPEQLESVAREIIDSNRFMTLATADERGLPWASPVYYAAVGYMEFLWVSDPGTRHSRNLAERPELGIVIFDSQVPLGEGKGVYMSAQAEQLAGGEFERGIESFSAASQRHGGVPWTAEDVLPPARRRLYRAVATEQFVLNPRDQRIPVSLA